MKWKWKVWKKKFNAKWIGKKESQSFFLCIFSVDTNNDFIESKKWKKTFNLIMIMMIINHHHNNVYGCIVVQLCFSLFLSLIHIPMIMITQRKKKTFDFGKSTTTTTEKFYDMDFFVCSLEKRNHFLFHSHLIMDGWMEKNVTFLCHYGGEGKMKIVNIF